MILQKLVEYYEVKKEQGEIAPYGWEKKPIPFFIQLNEDGTFAELVDTRADSKDMGQICLIPKTVDRSGKNSWQTTFMLWDHIGYVLGLVTENENAATVEKQHQSFKKKLQELPQSIKQDKGVRAVILFLENADFSLITKSSLWKELYKKKPNITFQLSSAKNSLIVQREAVEQYISEQAGSANDSDYVGKCLVSGESSVIARTHPKIKGVYGAQSSGAALVSFNDTAYTSFGKKQNFNAPMSKYTAFAYTTALDHLLKKNSAQKLHLGDTSIAFWAEEPHPIEKVVSQLFSSSASSGLQPKCLADIRKMFAKAKQEKGKDTEFYILALSPNASRLSIRFWHRSTVKEVAYQLERYFSEIEVDVGGSGLPLPRFRQLMGSLTLEYKLENMPSSLLGQFLCSIFDGSAYPRTIMNLAVARNRAEQNVSRYRAALIKAVLIRTYCYKDITMSLDTSRTDAAYRMGRLFAVYEYMQELAQGKSNLAERYYGGASSSPATVFPVLVKLSHTHLSRLDKTQPSIAASCRKQVGEILDSIDDYNHHFSLQQQGLFALGYYHQRQATLLKKSA